MASINRHLAPTIQSNLKENATTVRNSISVNLKEPILRCPAMLGGFIDNIGEIRRSERTRRVDHAGKGQKVVSSRLSLKSISIPQCC
jgi:hypothetical protein